MTRYVYQVAVGFAVGALVAALGVIHSPMPLIGEMAAFSISGAIGGASLRRGWRPVVGFGLAFGVFGVFIPLAFVAPQGMSKDSEVFPLVLCFLIGFGLAGGIGAAISGLGWRMALAGAAGFGVAGAIGGTVFAIVFLVAENIPFFLIVFVPVLIPHALGGALLAVALEYPSYKRKKLGLCLKCGYDLRGLPKHGHRCPECGTPFELYTSVFPSRTQQHAKPDQNEIPF